MCPYNNSSSFFLATEPLPKHAKRNTYVSMPLTSESLPVGSDADRDSIYQSIEYETPAARHQYAGNQYAGIDEPDRDTSGRINRGKLFFAALSICIPSCILCCCFCSFRESVV